MAEIQLHDNAEKQLRSTVDRLADALAAYSEAEATKSGADIVLTSHVLEAERKLLEGTRRSRVRELAGILGAAFFGAFVQGIVTELTKDSIDATPVSIYLSMGFVGMAAVFLSVR